LRSNLRQGELPVLEMLLDGILTWENLGMQNKIIVLSSAYREEVVDRNKLIEFTDELGVPYPPTREELVEALSEDGFEVEGEGTPVTPNQ